MKLPEHVEYIIGNLMEHGYEAYAVGGCVRDTLLGRTPGDWDITTSASPDEVKRIFRRTIDTGIEHGTVTVMLDKCGYEVTTYRIDGEYEDGRHPKSVEFTKNLVEDLKRRDFTINAMAYNHQTGLVDVFDGIGDLKRKRIRCVGEAKERFTEDALRMLRAVRFAAQLGFTIEESTLDAIRALAPNLSKISRERIQAELTKLLVSAHPQMVEKIFSLGLAKQVLPELAVYYEQSDAQDMLHRLVRTEADPILRYTVFLSIVEGTPQERREKTRGFLRELRFDNHTTDFVSRLSEHRDAALSLDKPRLRRQIVEIGEDILPYLLQLQQAESAEKLYRQMKADGDCLSVKELAVNGRDLIEAGVKQGKAVGEALNEMLYLVLNNPQLNTRENLLALVKEE
ncbi:MAG: CCA tRNA nucleotidyltransferase [Lachnospiraceae bacterium]|nr:CCA tRNA nucleotidyltransferase [Lachnospiraceae bacterium]